MALPLCGRLHIPVQLPRQMSAFDPLRTLAVQANMPIVARSSNGHPQTLGAAYWAVQPRWVRFLVLLVALPAWLVLVYGVLTGELSTAVEDAAIGLFACVGAIELVYVTRAYWRLDL
jgi:hypothetical protein